MEEAATGLTIISIIGVIIGALFGWVMNIVALVALVSSDAGSTGMLIARCLGVVFAPLGAVLGYC